MQRTRPGRCATCCAGACRCATPARLNPAYAPVLRPSAVCFACTGLSGVSEDNRKIVRTVAVPRGSRSSRKLECELTRVERTAIRERTKLPQPNDGPGARIKHEQGCSLSRRRLTTAASSGPVLTVSNPANLYEKREHTRTHWSRPKQRPALRHTTQAAGAGGKQGLESERRGERAKRTGPKA